MICSLSCRSSDEPERTCGDLMESARDAASHQPITNPATDGATGNDPVLTTLRRLGARPVSVSKYCAGVALLHPEAPRARWAQVLREHFADAA